MMCAQVFCLKAQQRGTETDWLKYKKDYKNFKGKEKEKNNIPKIYIYRCPSEELLAK